MKVPASWKFELEPEPPAAKRPRKYTESQRKYNLRWQKENKAAVRAIRKRYRDKTALGAFNDGRGWSPEEDALLFCGKLADSTIAMLIGRSLNALQNRRHRLKRHNSQQQDG